MQAGAAFFALRLHIGQAHPQRSVGHLEHIVAAVGDDAHIGRHARQQPALGVLKTHHRHIGHHIGHVLRRFAHLKQLALKALGREGVHREAHLLSGLDAAHIGLINRGLHLHVRQVLGDHKHLGRLQTGRHRLAALHRPLDDNAAHWRDDAGAAQVHPRLRQLRLALRHHRLGVADLRLVHPQLGLGRAQALFGAGERRAGAIGLALGNKALRDQLQIAFVHPARLGQVAFGARDTGARGQVVGLGGQHGGAGGLQIGLGRAHPELKGGGVELGDHLTGLHLAVEIGKQLFDLARNLRTHRDLRHWVHIARRRHRGHDRPALDGACAPSRGLGLRALQPPPSTASHQRQQHHHSQPTCFCHGQIVESRRGQRMTRA